MFGIEDFLLGGVVPALVAALVYAAASRVARSSGLAWSAGLILGYAAGTLALEQRDTDMASAVWRLVKASESHDWLAALALVGVVPAASAAWTRRSWVQWAVAAPFCVAAPLVLLWGKYRASQALRDAGFADDAVTPGQAALLLATIASAMVAAMVLWSAAPRGRLPRTRSTLAVVATVGAAAAAALTGALGYAQALGVLAAALGGAGLAAGLLRDDAGPEAARGPAIALLAGLLLVAAVYSNLKPWQAAALAAAFTLPVGWLPRCDGRRMRIETVARVVLCAVPLASVLYFAAAEFLANERQSTGESAISEAHDYFAE